MVREATTASDIDVKYCKIPIISPGLIFAQRAFSVDLISGRQRKWGGGGLIIGRRFAFKNGLAYI